MREGLDPGCNSCSDIMGLSLSEPLAAFAMLHTHGLRCIEVQVILTISFCSCIGRFPCLHQTHLEYVLSPTCVMR